jgi:hypothetical protein
VASIELAAITFTFAGYANGLLLVYERLLIQATVADALVGRVFGVKEALTAWAFGIAFLTGGALVAEVGVQDLILAGGALALLVFVAASVLLRDEWTDEAGEIPRLDPLYGGADLAGADGGLGEHGADVVRR